MYIGEMVLFMQAILKIHKLMKKLSKTQKRNKNIGKLNAMRVISRIQHHVLPLKWEVYHIKEMINQKRVDVLFFHNLIKQQKKQLNIIYAHIQILMMKKNILLQMPL
jgi:hypothetical protein